MAKPKGILNPRTFREPPAEFRPSPFWSVNADLPAAEQQWQVREMKKAGMGGFFYHPRVGLVTPYLSEAWFALVRACVDEARRQKMEAWLYDEDKWPSGFAGGLLLDRFPDFRMREMLFGRGRTRDEAKDAARKLRPAEGSVERQGGRGKTEPPAYFAAKKAGGGRFGYRKLEEGEEPRSGEEVLCFLIHHAANNNWHAGKSYTDLMNPECVREFIRMTHGEYVKRFRRDIGKTIPGIFTDEPNNRNWMPALPWTKGFEDVLSRALPGGADRLPALILPTADAAEVRHTYMTAVSARFTESYSKQIGEFCARNRLLATGHMLCEDDMYGTCTFSGAVMPHYEWMQVPGIDHLCRQAGQRLTHKQVSSAARQFGRNRVMCEIFGVSGHSMAFEDYKWIGDWHLVNGINFFVPHLTLQSMAGDRKRDYPPTISWHQPYWPDLKSLYDYFARIAYALRQGRAVADILVLHPVDSAWLVHRWDSGWGFETNNSLERNVDAGINAVMDSLAAAHRDFDLGDGAILARHGSAAGKVLRVAREGAYRAVVVPPSANWRESTVRLLEKYAAAGGPLVFAGATPTLVDGKPAAARWRRLLARPSVRHAGTDAGSLERALMRLGITRDLDIQTPRGAIDGDVVYQHRKAGTEHLLFLVNRRRDAAKRCRVAVPFRCTVERFDPMTGGAAPQPAERSGTRTEWVVELPQVGSALFRLAEGAPPAAAVPQAPAGRLLEVKLANPVSVTPDRPNILVLDRCRFTVNGAGDGKLHPVYEARKAAFEAAGLGEFAGLQPWRMRHLGVEPTRTARTVLTFNFQVGTAKPPALELVLETPECYEVILNGTNIPALRKERWLGDPGLWRVPLGGAVKRGVNELKLSGVYGLAMEVEDLFLLGRFCVAGSHLGPFIIRDFTAPRGPGDWTAQGFPFYTGAMTYRFKARLPGPGECRLRLGKSSGSVFRVRVDGKDRGKIWCAPWEADLGRLSAGAHTLEIGVVSTLQNAFGPLHHTYYRKLRGYNWWIGPDAFTEPSTYTPEYHRHPYGLFANPILILRSRA